MRIEQNGYQLAGVVLEVIEVQRIVVPSRGKMLIDVHGSGDKSRIEVETFPEASDELFQGDIHSVTRNVAMVGDGVDTGTWTAT